MTILASRPRDQWAEVAATVARVVGFAGVVGAARITGIAGVMGVVASAAVLSGCGGPPPAVAPPEPGATSAAAVLVGSANGTTPVASPGAENPAATPPPSEPLLIASATDPQEVAAAEPKPSDADQVRIEGCGAGLVPRVRTAGGLTVTEPARRLPDETGRLRTHVRGALGNRSPRTWAGRDVPMFVPIASGSRELFLLDDTEDGLLAYYRDPYDSGSCKLGAWDNCAAEARLFACDGTQRWRVDLGKLYRARRYLEVQDVRYADHVLYYNEACATYARDAHGQCSWLVAVEPMSGRVIWRTQTLRSNGVFLVFEKYIVTGYGFTAEPDFLYVLRKKDGGVASKVSLPSAHEAMKAFGDVLHVTAYLDKRLDFRMDGFDGDHPRLVPVH